MVLSIMAMFAGMAVPRFANFFAQHRAESAVRRIETDLTLARRQAKLTGSQRTVLVNPTTEIYTLPGITVAEMDWTKLTKDIRPQLDPLAKLLPHDQHALLFPSFRAMTQLLDEANTLGTPLLHLLQSRSESARSRERYQKQLCLQISDLSRLLGPKIIRSVAFTGSDPYLRTGTDVAILFEAKSPLLVRQYLLGKYALARKRYPDCKRVIGTVAGMKYVGVVSPQRRICSYVASVGDVVIVTNSLMQIERFSATQTGKTKSLASLPEYRFFRHRYQRGSGGESALLIVTDATIRRWCSPKWRIATSRRTRAAAVLSHHQAANLSRLVAEKIEPTPVATNLYVPDLGSLVLSNGGVASSVYGTLEFMTPISELNLDRVTQDEAKAYRRWRDSYQSYWRQFFDPIAVRFSVTANKIAVDVTVMPLIEQSDYREMIQLAAGVTLKANAGDRHAGSLLHWALAINQKAMPVRRITGFLPVNPLSWMGESIAVYVDADPFWLEFAKAGDKEKFLQNQFHRMPIAFHAEVKSGLKLALFLTGLRTYIDKSAPGMVVWKTKKYNGQAYVKMEATERLGSTIGNADQDLAIYYVATPKAFTVTLNENVLKRAIDREIARRKAGATGKVVKFAGKPWLGSSAALQIDGKALGFFEAYFGENYRQIMQSRAWANLPVLNEWKRRYPDRDPVELHQRHWKIQLRCPGGGKYVWNEKYQTMASTVYGHPGEPKPGPKLPPVLQGIRSAGFGLTFENKGLRARLNIQRGKR
ncbi:MAG: hypothetical protein IID45_03470 [Planctomycetes bacterium]|nr:hypothetical protein [Planctomycetota bacterium]